MFPILPQSGQELAKSRAGPQPLQIGVFLEQRVTWKTIRSGIFNPFLPFFDIPQNRVNRADRVSGVMKVHEPFPNPDGFGDVRLRSRPITRSSPQHRPRAMQHSAGIARTFCQRRLQLPLGVRETAKAEQAPRPMIFPIGEKRLLRNGLQRFQRVRVLELVFQNGRVAETSQRVRGIDTERPIDVALCLLEMADVQ